MIDYIGSDPVNLLLSVFVFALGIALILWRRK